MKKIFLTYTIQLSNLALLTSNYRKAFKVMVVSKTKANSKDVCCLKKQNKTKEKKSYLQEARCLA